MKKEITEMVESKRTEYYCDRCGKEFKKPMCSYPRCPYCKRDLCEDCRIQDESWGDCDRFRCPECDVIIKKYENLKTPLENELETLNKRMRLECKKNGVKEG